MGTAPGRLGVRAAVFFTGFAVFFAAAFFAGFAAVFLEGAVFATFLAGALFAGAFFSGALAWWSGLAAPA